MNKPVNKSYTVNGTCIAIGKAQVLHRKAVTLYRRTFESDASTIELREAALAEVTRMAKLVQKLSNRLSLYTRRSLPKAFPVGAPAAIAEPITTDAEPVATADENAEADALVAEACAA